MSLHQLNPATIKLITSSQVITSVSTTVKELVENSLDAGATLIEVRLENNGLDKIEIKDNGCGISKLNISSACLPHFTSKIKDFSDLNILETYGFRGEALSSLCQVSQVDIISKTQDDEFGTVYSFGKNGEILNSKPIAFNTGTQIIVNSLFKNLPVRKQFLKSGKKSLEDLKKTEYILKTVGAIHPGLKLSFFHNKCLIWQKSSTKTIKQALMQVISLQIVSKLHELKTQLENISIYILVPQKEVEDITFLCKSNIEHVMLFVKKRPIRNKKIEKILVKYVSEFFGDKYPAHKYPHSLISIDLPSQNIDVNLEPNKTKVLIKDENRIIEEIENQLMLYYNKEEIHPNQHTNVIKNSIDEKEIEIQDPPSKRIRLNTHSSEILKDGFSVGSVQNQSTEINGVSVTIENNSNQVESTESFLNENKECINNSFDHIQYNIINQSKKFHEDPENNFNKIETSIPDQSSIINSLNHMENNPTTQSKETKGFSVTKENSLNQLKTSTESFLANPKITFNHDSNFNSQTQQSNITQTTQEIELKQAELESDYSDLLHGLTQQDFEDLPDPLTQQPNVHARIDLSETEEDNDFDMKNNSNNEIIQNKNIEIKEINKNITNNQMIPRPTSEVESTQSSNANETLPSPSSQMGQKNLSGFTKFTKEMRPIIIEQNPGISFTRVAAMLVEQWRSLDDETRENYEKMAKEKNKERQQRKFNIKDLSRLSKQKKYITDWILDGGEKRKRPKRKKINLDIKLDDIIKPKEKPYSENLRLPILIGQLKSGLWTYKFNNEIGIIRHWGLEELVTFNKLMEEETLECYPPQELLILKKENFDSELWEILTSFDTTFDISNNSILISSPIITKNGFKIEFLEDSENAKFIIKELATQVYSYGIDDLVEILELISKNKTPSNKLSNFRPQKLINYFKNQTIISTRNSNQNVPKKEDLYKLMTYCRTKNCDFKTLKCLHDRNIFSPTINLQIHEDFN